jgi:hypothetical protein
MKAFRNVQLQDKGRMVCGHVHAIAWGRDLDYGRLRRELDTQFEVPMLTLGTDRRPIDAAKVQRLKPTQVDLA